MTKRELTEVNREVRRIKAMRQMLLLILVLALLASMTACASSLRNKIPGTYDNGYHTLDFYRDGTYEESSRYGTGKWTLLDGNVLKLTDFYGRTKTYTIKKVTSEGIVLEDGSVWERKG